MPTFCNKSEDQMLVAKYTQKAITYYTFLFIYPDII